MACAKQIFGQITQQHFGLILGKATQAGLPLVGNSGQASKGGFTVIWHYDPATQQLEIQCLGAPFLVPCSMVNSKIHDLVDSCAPGSGDMASS